LIKKDSRSPASKTKQGDPTADDFYSRIPPGEYEAICYRTKAGPGFGGRRSVYLFFRVYGGKYHGTEVFMACVYKGGKMSPRHKYYQQWVIANGRPPVKGELLARSVFKGKLFRILVRYTEKKHNGGKPMPDCVQYSVVDSILEPLTGISSSEYELSSCAVVGNSNNTSSMPITNSSSTDYAQGKLVDGN